ncbi:helix-turn-helix transcriptional regulator [Serratia sp. D1N4]
MKNVVLLCECNFTRTALETLLKPEARIFSTADVEQCRLHLSRSVDGEIDLIILSIDSLKVDTLMSLTTLIRNSHPSCRVLINPGSTTISLLRFYLNCLNTHVGMIDFTQSVQALQEDIGQVMQGKKVLSTRALFCGELLSWRERTVLQRLIKELKAYDIAKSLSLNVKTISHYKRAGLRKLGARNIQDLLIPATCRSPSISGSVKLHNITDAQMYQNHTIRCHRCGTDCVAAPVAVNF